MSNTFIITSSNQTHIIRKNNHVEKFKPLNRNLSKKEYENLILLDHPNIIKCFDYDEFNQVLKLEYIKGCNLHTYLEKNYLTEFQIYNIFKQVVEAIYYCHSNNISHGDIKLENCMIDDFGIVKVIDFEFAIKSNDDVVSVDKVSGTPIYLSPELAKIVNANMDKTIRNTYTYEHKPIDIWNLGIMLYELVYRYHPFSDCCYELETLLNNIMKEEVILWQNTKNNQLKNLIKNMLRHDTKKRYTIEQVRNSSWFKKLGFINKLPYIFSKKYLKYIIIDNNVYESYDNIKNIP